MKPAAHRFPLCLALVLVITGCAQEHKNGINPSPNGNKQEVNLTGEAIDAIERNDQDKLNSLLAADPELINADLSKMGNKAESLLEVAYNAGDNTSTLARFIDKGVKRESIEKLLAKVAAKSISDPTAESMLTGKLFLSHLAETRKREKELAANGLAIRSSGADKDTINAESVVVELDFYARAGETVTADPVSLKHFLSVGAATKSDLEAKIKLLSAYIAHLNKFDNFLRAYQPDTSKDLLQNHDARRASVNGHIKAREDGIGRIDSQMAKAQRILDRQE